jgi:hypothetical protein
MPRVLRPSLLFGLCHTSPQRKQRTGTLDLRAGQTQPVQGSRSSPMEAWLSVAWARCRLVTGNTSSDLILRQPWRFYPIGKNIGAKKRSWSGHAFRPGSGSYDGQSEKAAEAKRRSLTPRFTLQDARRQTRSGFVAAGQLREQLFRAEHILQEMCRRTKARPNGGGRGDPSHAPPIG